MALYSNVFPVAVGNLQSSLNIAFTSLPSRGAERFATLMGVLWGLISE